MNKTFLFCLLIILPIFTGNASDDLKDNLIRMDWDGIEVVWIKDEKFPTYSVLFYFGDGALSDEKGAGGVTNAMFNMLTAGTRRYGQKDISDYLEFYGTSTDVSVTHEYSVYSVSGLLKDIVPTMKQICHLFSDATFPQDELENERRRALDSMKNIINDHSSLASMIFREISMSGTPFSYPVSGKINDIKKMTRKDLINKHEYFMKKVKKKIYLTGPEQMLIVRNIINEECGWKGKESNFVRNTDYNQEAQKGRILLLEVPSANQSQIRIGRFLNKNEIKNSEIMSLTSGYLGGGFTSKLNRAVRVSGGLTYSIGAFAAGQKDYGRAAIQTFTKSETVNALIDLVKKNVEEVQNGSFPDEELERARGYLMGSYPFGFEKSEAYLSQVIAMEHEGRDLENLYRFPKIVEKIKKEEVINEAKNLFDWSKQTILVLGERSLKKKLEEYGKVEILNYKDFL